MVTTAMGKARLNLMKKYWTIFGIDCNFDPLLTEISLQRYTGLDQDKLSISKDPFTLIEIKLGIFVVSRPLSSKSLKSAEGFAGIYIRVLSESSFEWIDFCNGVIFGIPDWVYFHVKVDVKAGACLNHA